MITICLLACMLYVFGKIALFALKATWGISKILLTLVLAPMILLGLIFSGLFVFAIPLLLIVMFVSFVGGALS